MSQQDKDIDPQETQEWIEALDSMLEQEGIERGDYYENYQLLCGSGNSTKGNRTMEYLRMRIDKIEKVKKFHVTFGGACDEQERIRQNTTGSCQKERSG